MTKTVVSKSVSKRLNGSHTGIVRNIGELNQSLLHLRYEGKPMLGRNLGKVKLIFQSLDEALKADMILEEKILFPYLETHIPKLKFMIHIIEEEHEDLRRNLAAFRLLLEALFSKRPDRVKEGLIEKMRRKGRYLGYFLHNHTLAENETVYRVIETELNAREKEELNECFNSYRIRVNCFLN